MPVLTTNQRIGIFRAFITGICLEELQRRFNVPNIAPIRSACLDVAHTILNRIDEREENRYKGQVVYKSHPTMAWLKNNKKFFVDYFERDDELRQIAESEHKRLIRENGYSEEHQKMLRDAIFDYYIGQSQDVGEISKKLNVPLYFLWDYMSSAEWKGRILQLREVAETLV